MLGSLKCYDIVFVLTDGGPNYATEMFSTYIQKLAFNMFRQGDASAVGAYRGEHTLTVPSGSYAFFAIRATGGWQIERSDRNE